MKLETYNSTWQYDSLSNAYMSPDMYSQAEDNRMATKEELLPTIGIEADAKPGDSTSFGANTVADRVFGLQTRQAKISLESITAAMALRRLLHKQHMDDIQQRHEDIHGQMYGAFLHSRLDNHKRAMSLQNTLIRLDEQRRKEELSYWKDTLELRAQALESATEYGQARQRMTFLQNIEPLEGYYG